MNAAIMGVGSLGTVIGALAAKNGRELTLIDANKAHVEAMKAKGATVTGKMSLSGVPVKAITPGEMAGIYDLVILLAKQTHNDAALTSLAPHLGPGSVVCTLQNGIPEDSVAGYVGKERVTGGVVGWGASWVAPGVSELTSDVSAMRFEIGEIDGRKTPRIEQVSSILSLSGACEIVDNLMGIRWSKVIQNATLSGMSAALGATYAQILDDDKATACAAHIGNEIVNIVRKLDVTMVDLVPGWSYYDLGFTDRQGLEKAKAWLREYFTPHRFLKASMLQDMEKGIKCEIDHIVGICCQWGRKVGVKTPACDTVVSIIKDFEAGNIPLPGMNRLSRFSLPEAV